MTTAALSREIEAPADRVHGILLAASELPEWNPAFVKVEAPTSASVGTGYPLQVIRGLRGTLTYTHIEPDAITMSWHVPLLAETSTWRLLPAAGPDRTLVSHTVERHGALAATLRHTLADLPALRLERLAERAALGQPR